MLDLERAWIAGCSRCANEGISYEEDVELAHVELRLEGWTRGEWQFCPQCNGEVKA